MSILSGRVEFADLPSVDLSDADLNPDMHRRGSELYLSRDGGGQYCGRSLKLCGKTMKSCGKPSIQCWAARLIAKDPVLRRRFIRKELWDKALPEPEQIPAGTIATGTWKYPRINSGQVRELIAHLSASSVPVDTAEIAKSLNWKRSKVELAAKVARRFGHAIFAPYENPRSTCLLLNPQLRPSAVRL